MTRRIGPESGLRIGFALALFLSRPRAGLMGLKLETDRILRQEGPGIVDHLRPLGKIPEVRHLRLFGPGRRPDLPLGHPVLQHLPRSPTGSRYLDHIFSIIAELDPALCGSLRGRIAHRRPGGPRHPAGPEDPRPRGLEKNPDMWLFPFEAGHIARMQLKDDEAGPGVFRQGRWPCPGAPDLIRRLYASATFKADGLSDGLGRRGSRSPRRPTDPQIKKIAVQPPLSGQGRDGHRGPRRSRRRSTGKSTAGCRPTSASWPWPGSCLRSRRIWTARTMSMTRRRAR